MTTLAQAWVRRVAQASMAVARHRQILQFVAGGLAFGLGFWGWILKEHPADVAGYLNSFFRTLQLITLQFPTDFNGAIPWPLQVARLLVPGVAAAASFHILLGAISRPFRLVLLPHTSGHTIVCGDAQLTEAALYTLAESGEKIVVVAQKIDPARRDALEGFGMTLVEADVREPASWRELNIARARALFLTDSDDIRNLNAAMMAMRANAGRDPDKPPLVLAVLIEREDLAIELDSALDTLARGHGVRYRRLCPDRDGVRLELATYAPAFIKPDRDKASHILVFGLKGQWAQVFSALIVAAQDHPTLRPVLTCVLKSDEVATLNVWRADHPDLDLIVEFDILPAGPHLLPDANTVAEWRGRREAPHLAVVLTDDADAIGVALSLRRPGSDLGAQKAPILVRQKVEDRLLAALGATDLRDREFKKIRAFGGLVRAETISRVLDRKGDAPALALHMRYLEGSKILPPGSPAALEMWDDLPENLRDANRASTDHAPILFASADVDFSQSIPPEILDRLSRIEHRRWLSDRILRGWRFGAARDNDRLLHPNIVPYDALSKADQDKDTQAVQLLIELFGAR